MLFQQAQKSPFNKGAVFLEKASKNTTFPSSIGVGVCGQAGE